MQAKEYLDQIRICKNNIKHNLHRLDELKEMALATGSKELKADVIQVSLTNAGLEDTVGKYVDFEQSIREDIHRYLELKEKIVGEIENLNASPQYIQVLLERYNTCKRFEDIAVTMGYSYETIRHIHTKALIKFEKQYLEGD